jgi:hypothetical protein
MPSLKLKCKSTELVQNKQEMNIERHKDLDFHYPILFSPFCMDIHNRIFS